jgi:hypothetical protein
VGECLLVKARFLVFKSRSWPRRISPPFLASLRFAPSSHDDRGCTVSLPPSETSGGRRQRRAANELGVEPMHAAPER